MDNFFDKNENKDWKLLNDFNDKYHWFKSLHRFPKGERIDVSAVTRDDRKAFIELKNREQLYDDGLFIEPSKVKAFETSAATGDWLTLYINFIDGYLYLTDPLAHKDKMTSRIVRIWDKGLQKWKVELRNVIPLNLFTKWKME